MSSERRGNWQIAHIVGEVDESSNSPTTKIQALELMSIEDLQEYKSDKSVIFEYYNSLKMIQGVQLNIGQFLQAIVDYAADFHDTREMHEEKFDFIALDFSRLLLNILSMFRSLLDHSDTSLSRQFGKESPQVAKWKETLSHEFDSSFEYRFYHFFWYIVKAVSSIIACAFCSGIQSISIDNDCGLVLLSGSQTAHIVPTFVGSWSRIRWLTIR